MNSLQRLVSALSSTLTVTRRFAHATQGNVAMMFAISMPVMIMLAFGGVDIHRATTVRANLQDALDAATLAAARSPHITEEELRTVALASLRANLRNFPNVRLREDLLQISLTEDAVIITDVTVEVDTLIANIILPPYGPLLDSTVPVSVHSEVNRSSKNIEVALVLDITGSMAGQRIIDLKAAAEELIDIVVQDVQTPYYTRMAIVPYSMGVNLGTFADGARGTPFAATAINGASWTNGDEASISGITRSSSNVVTAYNHGFASGEYVWVSDVNGMTQINGRALRVNRLSADTLNLQRWNGSNWVSQSTTSGNGFDAYSSGGKLRQCHLSDCTIRVTSNGHGLSNGEGVQIKGVRGMTQINNNDTGSYWVSQRTDDTFSIGVRGIDWDDYTNSGNATCGRDGCPIRIFRSVTNAVRVLPTSTCVSERDGTHAYTDEGPGLAKVGRNYPTLAGNNNCPGAALQPLTSNKETLTDLIDDLPTVGSTAGQIGIAWGWYAVSPNFNGLWSGSQGAGNYDPEATIKSVIIMTDGEFNTPYCGGVIGRNASTGSGDNQYKGQCDGINPYAHSEQLCTAMKARGVRVYTVGFQIASGGAAAELMRDCATSEQHVYLPESGGDLSEAFAAIGRDITRLRISK